MKRYLTDSERVSCRILHIEDNPSDVFLTQTYLKRAGIQNDRLIHVETLKEGIEYLEKQDDVDFILLDLTLPDSIGLETFERCAKAAKACPILVLTGVAEREISRKLLDMGAYAFLQKDEITEAALFNAIYGVLKRKIYEQELRELKKKAENADQEKTRFLGLISHELRTPLSAILGFTEFLLEDASLSPKQNESLSRIKSNSLHLKTLVNDLVDLSEIELRRIELQERKMDLKRLLDDTVESIRVQRPDRKELLKVVHSVQLPRFIYSDATKIRQILLNLLGNAMKFAGKNGVEFSVEASPPSNGVVDLVFHVKDDGSGIPAESLPRLFQPYGRVHTTTDNRQGAGLGLVLSQRLARALGGDIVLDYTSQKGTRFTVTLKVHVSDQDQEFFAYDSVARETKTEKSSPTVAGELEGLTLLIVEDSKDLRDLYQAVLRARGVEKIQVAESGGEGLKAARSGNFDCILLDISLPDQDGFEVASQLRHEGNKTPIVALTAHVAPAIKERALSSGFDSLLTKPVPFELLSKTIKSAQLASR